MTVEQEYLAIIATCRFVSNEDEWFVEGTEAKIIDDVIYPNYKEGDCFNGVCGLFKGMTMETYDGYSGELPRLDEETCPFREFKIFDRFENEISSLTLDEYKKLLENNSHPQYWIL